MRKILNSITILIIVSSQLPGQNIKSPIIPNDKIQHMAAGSVIGAWGYLLPLDKKGIKPILSGLSCSAVAGIGKECYDKFYCGSKFDMKDVSFTIIGGAISIGIITGIKEIVNHKKYHDPKRHKKIYKSCDY